MKRTICIAILCLAVALGVAACGGSAGQPVLTAEHDTVYLLCGAEYDLSGAVTAKAGGQSVAVTVADDGGFDSRVPGAYTVTYTAVSGGQTAGKSVRFEVLAFEPELPQSALAGSELTVGIPLVQCGAQQTLYEVAYKPAGTDAFIPIAPDGQAAAFTPDEPGACQVRFTVIPDGQRLELSRSVEVYGVQRYNPAPGYAVLGQPFTLPAPVFSDNVDAGGLTAVLFRSDEADDTETLSADGGRYAVTVSEKGYYTVRFTASAGGAPVMFDYEFYARDAGMDIDMEGAPGSHFGFGDQQYSDNGHGTALLVPSDQWAIDGRYSLRQNSAAYWSGMEYAQALQVETSNAMSCYINSDKDYAVAEVSVVVDSETTLTSQFSVKKGVHRYFIPFRLSFDRVKKLLFHAENSQFYIDAIDFCTLDVSNILSLQLDSEIVGSDLATGDTLTLPIPAATSSVYSAEQLAGGTLTVTASPDGEQPFAVERMGDGFPLVVWPATYTFVYRFEYDYNTVELRRVVNVAKFDIRGDCPGEGLVGEEYALSNLTGIAQDAAITVHITDEEGQSRVLAAQDGSYPFSVDRAGYYTIQVQASNAQKNGTLTCEFYAREYDRLLDFEGVGSHRGYDSSYVAENLSGYVSISDEWAADGRYSAYVDMSVITGWYGTRCDLAVPVTDGNAITLTVNGSNTFTADTVIGLLVTAEDKDVWIYAQSFRILKGVHTYTLRLGASDLGVLPDAPAVPAFTRVKAAILASVRYNDAQFHDDEGKFFWYDNLIVHRYTAFEADFVRPDLARDRTCVIERPALTSEALTADEIAAIEFTVRYRKDDGAFVAATPTDGGYELTLTDAGVYEVELTCRNRYCERSAVYKYALGVLDFDADIPDILQTGEDIELTVPQLLTDADVSAADWTLQYRRAGDEAYTTIVKSRGQYVWNVLHAGGYTLRYTVECEGMRKVKEYDVYVRQSGVFFDYDLNGWGGYVDTPYQNDVFLPELSNEWSYDGDLSVKVTFVTDAWYGFNYYDDNLKVPSGTDRVSVWIKSDRDFKYASFLAFTAQNSQGKMIWYYTEQFYIEKGVNLYEVGITLYTDSTAKVKFTPATAGRIGSFTFHTEQVEWEDDTTDFGAVAYFDAIRFFDSEEAAMSSFTMLPAQKDVEYSFDFYRSPSGFSGEQLAVQFRRAGESEWQTVYQTDCYDGEDITYTFDFAGTADIRIIATYGPWQTSFRGTLTIK